MPLTGFSNELVSDAKRSVSTSSDLRVWGLGLRVLGFRVLAFGSWRFACGRLLWDYGLRVDAVG